MKRLALTAVLILVLGTAATAMQMAQSKTFMGAIASVDTEGKVLTVRDTDTATGAKTMSFKVDAQTKIEQGVESSMGKSESDPPSGSSLGLGDLKLGEHVNVTYVGSDGDYLARTITVQSKPTT